MTDLIITKSVLNVEEPSAQERPHKQEILPDNFELEVSCEEHESKKSVEYKTVKVHEEQWWACEEESEVGELLDGEDYDAGDTETD